MTREELIALAKEAGVVTAHNTEHLTIAGIERFANLVAAKEREACALVCEGFSAAEYTTGKVDHNEMAWTDHCAMSIRARKP